MYRYLANKLKEDMARAVPELGGEEIDLLLEAIEDRIDDFGEERYSEGKEDCLKEVGKDE